MASANSPQLVYERDGGEQPKRRSPREVRKLRSSAAFSAFRALFDELVDQQPRQTRLIVPHDALLLQQIAGDIPKAELLQFFQRRIDGLGALRCDSGASRRGVTGRLLITTKSNSPGRVW